MPRKLILGPQRRTHPLIWLCSIISALIFLILIVLVVVFFIRIRTPKVRLASASLETLNVNPSSKSPSFSLKVNAEVKVKNTNFGYFKFENSTATFSYRGTEIGKTTLVKARAKALSTKKFNVTVSFQSNKVSSNSHLGSDISSKNLTFSAYAKLKGKVHLFKVFKKKKSATMNCTFVVNTSQKRVNDLSCK